MPLQPWPDVVPGPLPQKEHRQRAQETSPAQVTHLREKRGEGRSGRITHFPPPNDSQAETLTNEAMEMSHTSTDEVISDQVHKMPGARGPHTP